jgi:magnesium chelatase subunit D
MYVFFLVDSSGSMLTDKQISQIKGLVAATIARYRTQRIRYAAVALTKGDAQLLSALTLDADEVLDAIARLTTGGRTNLKAGFKLISQLLKTNMQQRSSLYIFTDGKINAGDTATPFEEAVSFYQRYLANIRTVEVVDSENGIVKLGLAEKLERALKFRSRK